MKYLVVFIVAALAISAQARITDEQKAKMKKYYDDCVTHTGVDKELILKGRKNEFVEDAKLMHYYHCMMEKMGFQDHDGTLHPNVMIEKLPESMNHEDGTKLIKKCTQVQAGLTAHRIAYNVFKCVIENAGERIKFF